MSEKEFNPLKISGITVTWEVENIWNLKFDGVPSESFLISDRIFHLFVRRYELSFGVYLCRDDTTPVPLSLLCRLCIVDHIGQEKLIGEKEIVVEKGKESVLIDGVSIKELESRKNEFLLNDTLTISCNVSTSYRMILTKRTEHESPEIIPCYEKLSSDFETFYNAQKNSNALFKAEEKEFPVDRAVLCARAPVLASLLSHDTPETAVDISDIQSSIFGDVLFYVYTGKVRGLTTKTVLEMLSAAYRFSLLELKGICMKFLRSNLTEDNIFDVAVLAHENGDLILREEVEKYIIENIATILGSERWREFCSERYKFANEILTTVLLRMKKNVEDQE